MCELRPYVLHLIYIYFSSHQLFPSHTELRGRDYREQTPTSSFSLLTAPSITFNQSKPTPTVPTVIQEILPKTG